jgi:tetratricopeptide (TPR) repeat protein
MSTNAEELNREDLAVIVREAGQLARNCGHAVVDYAHLFVAIGQTGCKASEYVNIDNMDAWQAWLCQFYPGNEANKHRESVPLSWLVQQVILHAKSIALNHQEDGVNSMHILMALLCMENSHITQTMAGAGFLFEDIAAKYYQRAIQRTKPELTAPRAPYTEEEKQLLTPAHKQTELAGLYSHAYGTFLFGVYDACIATCELGLSLDPDHHDLKIMQLSCYLNQPDLDSALSYALQLVAQYPQENGHKIDLGQIYTRLHNYAEADKVLDRALDVNPYNPAACYHKGNNLLLQEQYEAAMPFFIQAIQADPQYSLALGGLGFVMYKLGDTDKAMELTQHALELDRHNALALKYRGLIYLEQNNKALALKYFKVALKHGYTRRFGREVEALVQALG